MAKVVISETPIFGKSKRKPLYGHIIEYDDGTKIYFVRRKHREIFRSGKTTISGAMQAGEAAWAIDEELLINLRLRSVEYVGVRVVDTGDVYLTKRQTFMDPKTSSLRDYTGFGKGGSRQRFVTLNHFALQKGVVDLSELNLY